MSLLEPAPAARPRLRGPARLKYDKTRETDQLLLPERVVNLNATAAAILKLCDGKRTVSEIVEELEASYGQTGLEGDVLEFLLLAADRGWVEP